MFVMCLLPSPAGPGCVLDRHNISAILLLIGPCFATTIPRQTVTAQPMARCDRRRFRNDEDRCRDRG